MGPPGKREKIINPNGPRCYAPVYGSVDANAL